MSHTTDAVMEWIMARVTEHGPEVSFAPSQILDALKRDEGTFACAMLPEALLRLIWEGKLVVTGPWRVRLPAPHEVKVKPPELVRIEEAQKAVILAARHYVSVDGSLIEPLVDAVVELDMAEMPLDVKGKNG